MIYVNELKHSSPWVDDKGNNTAAYNHKYWEEHKEEIMARRAELAKEREEERKKNGDPDEYQNDNYRQDVMDAVEEYLKKNGYRDYDYKKVIKETDAYIKNGNRNNDVLKRNADAKNREAFISDLIKGAHEEYTANIKKNKDRFDAAVKADQEQKAKENEKAAAESDSSTSKKKSGSSSKGSSSSKKSSSSSNKSKSNSSNGSPKNTGGKSSGGSKSSSKKSSSSGKSSGDSSKDKSGKDSTKKSATDTETKSGNKTDTVERLGLSGTTYSYDKDTMSSIRDNFSKIESDHDDEYSPENNYLKFISEFVKNGFRQVDLDEGLELWEMYRESKGYATSKEKMNEQKELAKEEEEKKKLQHGLDLFDEALEHHGIMGMHWGIRNGPPYPLDTKTSGRVKSGNAYSKATSTVTKSKLTDEVKKELSKNLSKDDEPTRYAWGNGPKLPKFFTKAAQQREQNKVNKQAETKAADDKARRVAAIEKRKATIEAKKAAEEEKANALKNADAQWVKEHLGELSTDELRKFADRINLNQQIERAIPQQPRPNQNVQNQPQQNPTQKGIQDTRQLLRKVDDVMNTVDTMRNWTNKGINAWNTVAGIFNSFNKENQLPVIDGKARERALANAGAEKAAKEAKLRNEIVNAVIRDPKAFQGKISNLPRDVISDLAKYQGDLAKVDKLFERAMPDITKSNTTNTPQPDYMKTMEDVISRLEDLENQRNK